MILRNSAWNPGSRCGSLSKSSSEPLKVQEEERLKNMSNNNSIFLLLGLVEMETQKYLYFCFSLMIYLFILSMNCIILFVVLKERSLHEPMYILIAILVLNEILGSSSFLPKLTVDLITSSKTISCIDCLIQIFCVTFFTCVEVSIFTVMAYDRYLAICHPLHYFALMNNEKAVKLIGGCWVILFVLTVFLIILTEALPLCGDTINNIFCENMSMVILSCVDSTTSRLYTISSFITYLVCSIGVTMFSYLRIIFVCLRLSEESRQKAVHTLVTHLLNFSIFLIGVLFIVRRYRLGTDNISLTSHVLLSATAVVCPPPICNPLIYGLRTQALRVKVIQHLQNLHFRRA
ncbi:olfactory receptor 4B13-like [Hyperolius riggenbachi]|uniref:olfactory receptor 4B13-like n=1 Tax=Hyperolius riggenbachi TaxID=752182 RepID=UPI0035A34836